MKNKILLLFILFPLSMTLSYAQVDSVFLCSAAFKDSKYDNAHAGSGFVLQYKGKHYGITAKHVLFFAKTDSMKTISFNNELKSWEFISKINAKRSLTMGRLVNENPNEPLAMPPIGDWLIFELEGAIPKDVAVYSLRNEPLKIGDPVYFMGHPYKSDTAVRVDGTFIGEKDGNSIRLDVPEGNYGGCSGGPVLDQNHKLVGIVSMGYFNKKENTMVFEPASLDYFKEVIDGSSSLQKTEYYRHLVFRESPYSDFKGIHPIDKDQSMEEAHYQFVYDRQNRLVEVSHKIGNDLIGDNGNWDSFMWFNAKVTIAYSEGKEVRHFYNRLDENIETHGKMYKAVFTLDERGQRTSLKFYDKEDQPSENAWGIHSYAWTEHNETSVMEERFSLNGESRTVRPNFTFHKIKLVYGNDDYLDFMYYQDEDGNLINNTMKAAMDRIVYDNEGNFSRWMVFDKDKKLVEGNAPQLAIGEHLYDTRGNKVELRGFDVEGRSKAMPSGVARELKSYDSYNNQIEVKTLDIDGKMMEHIKQEFSVDGKRLEWIKFYDDQGNLTMHSSGQFAALKFEYDANGRFAARKNYDVNLKEIKNNANE
ncbi:MAG: serine protease [Saprospiraceae bacterium]|nr:serine protease [Saprospiraceae bacterium]